MASHLHAGGLGDSVIGLVFTLYRHIVHPQTPDERQAQAGAVEVDAEIQAEDVGLDAFLQADAHSQQSEKGKLHAASRR